MSKHSPPAQITWPLAALAVLAILSACQSTPTASRKERPPSVVLREAPLVQFRGANSTNLNHVGDTDCNSPAHWDGETLFLFNSAGHPWRSSGPDLFHLHQTYVRTAYNNQVNGGRWIECTWKADDGVLYGWYHNEPGGLCPGTRLTAPKIGAVRSKDNGATWHDLGIILEARPNTLRCDTKNYYFAGGNGDFSVMADAQLEYLYFFISTYAGEVSEQGVSVARMRYADRDQPVAKVWKWHAARWNEPGLGGRVTPIFPVKTDWHRVEADAFGAFHPLEHTLAAIRHPPQSVSRTAIGLRKAFTPRSTRTWPTLRDGRHPQKFWIAWAKTAGIRKCWAWTNRSARRINSRGERRACSSAANPAGKSFS